MHRRKTLTRKRKPSRCTKSRSLASSRSLTSVTSSATLAQTRTMTSLKKSFERQFNSFCIKKIFFLNDTDAKISNHFKTRRKSQVTHQNLTDRLNITWTRTHIQKATALSEASIYSTQYNWISCYLFHFTQFKMYKTNKKGGETCNDPSFYKISEISEHSQTKQLPFPRLRAER